MVLVRRLPTCVKLVTLRSVGSLITSKRTFAAEAKPKKIAVITGASRLVSKSGEVIVMFCVEGSATPPPRSCTGGWGKAAGCTEPPGVVQTR